MRVRSVLVLDPPSPPQTYAPVSNLRRNQVTAVSQRSLSIQLEEWSLSLDRLMGLEQFSTPEDPYPGVYKQAIVLMRGLYALLRSVPAWQLYRKLASESGMKVAVFASLAGGEDAFHEGGLDSKEPNPISFEFPAIMTPLGAITLRAWHRPDVHSELDTVERFRSMVPEAPLLKKGKARRSTPLAQEAKSNTKQANPAPVPWLSIRKFLPSWVSSPRIPNSTPYLTKGSTTLLLSTTIAPYSSSVHSETSNGRYGHQSNDYPVNETELSSGCSTMTPDTWVDVDGLPLSCEQDDYEMIPQPNISNSSSTTVATNNTKGSTMMGTPISSI
ncbi:autophagy-related protein 13-domain-containing protein [Rhizoctonia solani]|nr:autophagy-related protein 13-domain-containing protein [Rhizoctonia solani]